MDLLLNSPTEITTIILSQYCDGKSLSTLLVTFASSTTHRQFIPYIVSSLQARVEMLHKQDLIPPVERRTTARWPHFNFVDFLLSYKNGDDDDDDDANLTTWPNLLAHIRPISERLTILSFFEDYHLQLSTNYNNNNFDNKDVQQQQQQPKKENLVEWPLWCGTISMDCNYHNTNHTATTTRRTNNNNNNNTIQTANVVATTPSTTWHHVLVSEWSKFSQHHSIDFNDGDGDPSPMYLNKRPPLKPIPSRATPLPPLARLRGISSKDRLAIRNMARRLRELDEVASMGERPVSYLSNFLGGAGRGDGGGGPNVEPMKVLFMSRKQAVRRLRSRKIRNMWPLEYECTKYDDDNDNDGIDNDNNCYFHLRKIETLHGAIASEIIQEEEEEEERDELFAFMDGPYIGFDFENEEDSTLPEFSSVVSDLRKVMKVYYLFDSLSTSARSSGGGGGGGTAAMSC